MAVLMMTRDQWRELRQSKPVRTALFVVGILLIIASPIFGLLPGPGGIFVFAGGLALALQNSDWAKRRYVKFKRHQPQAGNWMDWGLRRRSAKRREARRKEREEATGQPSRGIMGRSPMLVRLDCWLRQNARPLFRLLQRRRVARETSSRRLLDRLIASRSPTNEGPKN
ncbi:MAG TPA: hypothetical protein VF637_09765 [Sphingomicrobium sp.]|jgi:hypothetical protein